MLRRSHGTNSTLASTFHTLLPVLESKATYVRQCFGFVLTADTVTTRSISRFCTTADTTTADSFGLAAIRASLLLLLWILPVVLQVSRRSVLRILQVLTVFRPLAVFVLRVLAVVPNYSQYAHYT